jgi:beta-phosphoglucomutase-like phosphatase (HAD superfamily)
MEALIFDCDGVLVDTERDGHRVAFNRAFAALGLPFEWSVEAYGELLKIRAAKSACAPISITAAGRWKRLTATR